MLAIAKSDLLREALVDASGLQGELLHAVHVVLLLRNSLWRSLSHSQHVQAAAVPLVEEQLVARPGDHNVPGVDGPRGAHEGGQEGVCDKYPPLVLACKLPARAPQDSS